jgi:glycosyltransferase involved in cell wall biosynthesis
VERDVRFLDWLSGEEFEGLWRVARAFVYPSLYEGFGLPVLEAMARGVPVACSSSSSLPEVAGDAALLFDPHDEHAIAAALQRLLSDGEEDRGEVERLCARGRARAREFTWERTARLALESYRRALGAHARRVSPGEGTLREDGLGEGAPGEDALREDVSGEDAPREDG